MIPDLIFPYVFLLLFGFGYAYMIYKHAPKEGKTWISVVIGVGATLIGISGTFVVVLRYFGELWLAWYMIPLLIVGFGFTGIPMIYGQSRLEKEQDEEINRIKNGNKKKHTGLA